jgi:hypothetical protein
MATKRAFGISAASVSACRRGTTGSAVPHRTKVGARIVPSHGRASYTHRAGMILCISTDGSSGETTRAGPTLLLHRVHDFLERSRAFRRPDCDNWHCRYAREQIGCLARKERGWMRRGDVQSFTLNYVSRRSHTKADHLRKGAWLPRSFTLSTINLITFSFRSTG